MKKLIAGFMTALIALLTATSPVLAAEQLGNYPAFLEAADGTLETYVVIGSQANVADVIGAVDLAARLAETGAAATSQECPGASSAVAGVSKDTVTIQRGFLDDFFPGSIRGFHFDKLKTGTISWASNNYDYYEDIYLGADQIYTSHDFSTTGINGTQTLVIPTNVLKYRYTFKKALNLTAKSGYGTISGTSEYTYPINIELLGKTFQIVGIGADQVKMLAGSVGTATATTPVVYGDYSVYSDLGNDNGWARVIVKDGSDNTVDTLVINEGSDKTSTVSSLTIKVTDVRALQDGTVVGADLVVGAINAVEKTYPASCDISGTGSSDYKFPGETEWCIQADFNSASAASGNIAVDDRIEVVYKPSTTKYIKSTEADPSLTLPNGYGKVGFVGNGFNYDSWTTLTFTPVSGKTAYWDDGMTGASNTTLAASNLNGIEISSDVAGSIVDPIQGTNGYNKAYILFNYTLSNSSESLKYPVMVGFYDSVNSRIAVDLSASDYIRTLDTSGLAENITYRFNFTISYSNGAAAGDRQYLNVTAKMYASDLRLEMFLGRVGYNNSVNLTWQPKTTTWSASAAPELRLGSSTSAQAEDIKVLSTDTSGVSQIASVGAASQDVVTDSGAIVVSPATYTASDMAKVKVPAQVLYAKLYVGSLSGSTSGSTVSYTSYPSIPITSAIAKLDTEITSVEKASNLISVGGPCVNTVSADALGVTYPACGASSTIPEDKGIIKSVDDVYTNGKVVLVVAGWEAVNTRTATSVLQQFNTKLAGVTASSVEVTGSIGSPVVAEV